jgi:hypothetical protein
MCESSSIQSLGNLSHLERSTKTCKIWQEGGCTKQGSLHCHIHVITNFICDTTMFKKNLLQIHEGFIFMEQLYIYSSSCIAHYFKILSLFG